MYNYAYENYGDDSERNIDLELYYCGREECSPGHFFGPGIKDHFKLHYIHSGKGLFISNEQTYTLAAGQIFLIYPNTLAYYESNQADPWSYSWIAFDGLNSEIFLKRAGFSIDRPIKKCDNCHLVESYITQLLETSQINENRDMKLTGYLYLFFSSIMNKSDKKNSANRPNEYVKKAIKYIQMNYSKDMHISEISSYLSLERKYFSRIFKAHTGTSPQNFLLDFRLKKACVLLSNSSLSIGEIATSVGYKDQLSFSRIFKKQNGISPSFYKKNPESLHMD